LQALSAVFGGTQSLHTNSLDEALALPTERSARVALRTQQIIAHETGVASTIDPLAGSYYVEWLTDEIETGVMDYLRRIEEMGGAVQAIEEGFQQAHIQEAAYQWQSEVDGGQRIIVGVNSYKSEEEVPTEIHRVDPSLQARQVGRLRRLKEERDESFTTQNLERLRNAARSNENLMPFIIECVQGLATLGEISDALRSIFGLYDERPLT
jgi:methylmalonyl-CoA mutase N-terminal domain/subunit